jgi:hypothetical protein
MRAKILNVYGVTRVELSAARIALLAGGNGAGKSSVLHALAAALTGRPLPPGILKKEAPLAVHRGATGGSVVVSSEGDRGSVSVEWPSCAVKRQGAAPAASPIAAGLDSLLDMSSVERARYLAAVLKTDPSLADLVQAMVDSGLEWPDSGTGQTAEVEPMTALGLDWRDRRQVSIFRAASPLQGVIEVDGWDGAHRTVADDLSQIRGGWRQVTGKVYGVRQAAEWVHPDAGAASPPQGKTLDQAAADAKVRLDDLLRRDAVGRAMESDRALADDLENRREAAAVARKNWEYSQNTVERLNATPRPTPLSVPLTCPHCGCDVALENDVLIPVSHSPRPQDVAARAKTIAEFDAKVKAAMESLAETEQRLGEADRAVAEAEAARERLKKAGAADSLPTSEELQAARATLRDLERAAVAEKATVEAGRLRRAAIAAQALADLLAPGGLRKAKLARVLKMFSESYLDPLTEAAGWKRVEITPEMTITCGGVNAREPLLSESQVMRTRVALQVALARLDGSDIVLIDRADCLDRAGRNGLFALLAAAGVRAVVAMTMNAPRFLPDLAGSGLGESYWVENGVATPRAAAVAPHQQAAE